VAGVADRQGCVVSRSQALALGHTRGSITRRLATREWLAVHRAVYRVAALGPDAGTELWAAHLAVPGSAVAGAGALWRYGLLDRPTRPALVVATSWAGASPRGALMTRSSQALSSSQSLRGMQVVGLPVALTQLLAAGHPDGPDLLDRAIQLRTVSLAAVADAASALGPGGRRARSVVAAAADGAASHAERVLLRALRAAGVTGLVPNARVGRWVLDIAFPDAMVAVEVDGWAHHHAGDRFQRDRTRQNALVLAGWTVLRFTWRDVDERIEGVVAEICAAVGR